MLREEPEIAGRRGVAPDENPPLTEKRLPVIQTHPTPVRDAAPPPFDRIGIVGLGLVGGSVALAARSRWPAALVIGIDAKDVLEHAMALHAIDVGADDLGMLKEADLVLLATPVGEIVRLLSQLETFIPGDAVVTDTGSTKRRIVEAARALPSRLTFVGGHPLGGAARGGLAFARPDLFAGRPWIFTPTSGVLESALQRLRGFAAALGATPQVLGADEHDRLLAAVSHLPQIVVSALMHVVGERAGAHGLALAGRGLQETTRLASSPPTIWRAIAGTNADEIGPAIDALVSVLQVLRADLNEGRRLEEIFESAAAWKARLPARDPEP